MSRKVLILANVGNRDVMHDGEIIHRAREKGAELLGRFGEVKDNISLPIIQPVLKRIGSADDWGLSGDEPTMIGLFCTDQEDSRHRANDTIEFARIIQRKLLQSSPKDVGIRFANKKAIALIPLKDQNPARYDDMYSFYRDFFSSDDRIKDPEEWICFVLLSGGIPAMNAMLLFHAIQHFEEGCVQLYVSPNDGVVDMPVGEEMVRASVERRFDEALKTLQFRAAATVLESTGRGGYRAAACRYAEYRLAFDFRKARECCRQASRGAEGDVKRYLDGHARTTQNLENGDSNQALLLEELFYNLEVKYRSGEFVDVLGRMFRLQEALLTWIVEGYTGIRTGPGKKLMDHKDDVDAVPGLMESLRSYKTADGNKLEMKREINRIALMAVTQHLSTPESDLAPDDQTRAANAATAAASIEKLVNLRNKTIIAHGFEGVSEEDVVRVHGSDTLIKDLRASVSAALNRDLSANPFFDLAEKLRF